MDFIFMLVGIVIWLVCMAGSHLTGRGK